MDELGSLSFSIFDGASVAEWRGKDLRLADNIPNIDLLVLGIEKVTIEFLLRKINYLEPNLFYVSRFLTSLPFYNVTYNYRITSMNYNRSSTYIPAL